MPDRKWYHNKFIRGKIKQNGKEIGYTVYNFLSINHKYDQL